MPRPKKRQNEESLRTQSSESDSKCRKMSDRSDTYDFTKAKSYTDLVLKVDGRCLHVSRSVLMMSSPVFQKMFELDFCEKNKDTIELPHKNFDDVHSLLKLLVPGCGVEKLTYDVALKVYPLAHEYQMDEIKTSCTDVLVKAMDQGQVKVTDILDWLSFAGTYGLTSLEDACTKRLTQLDRMKIIQIANLDSDITIPWRCFKSILKSLADSKDRCAEHEEVKGLIKRCFEEHEDHCRTRHLSCSSCCQKKCEPVSNWANSSQTLSPYCWQQIVYSLIQCNKFMDWLITL